MKKIFIPFAAREYEYMESFLEDMAAKGLFLKKKCLSIGTFEESEPRQMKYRIIPQISGKVESTEQNFYEDFGWQLVTSSGGLSVFSCDTEDDNELFTDESSYEKRCRSFRNGCFASVFSGLLLIYIYIINLIDLKKTSESGILHSMNDLGPLTFIFMGIMLILAIIIIFVSVVGHLIACRRLKKGIHRTGLKYKKLYMFNAILYILAIIVIVLSLLFLVFEENNSNYTSYTGKSEKHPISIEKIDEQLYSYIEQAEREETSLINDVWVSYTLRDYSTILFSEVRIADLEMDSEDGNEYTMIITSYYKARNEKNARKYVQEELSQASKAKYVQVEDVTSKYPQIDEVYYIKNSPWDEMIMVRNGKVIEIIVGDGCKSIKDDVEDVVEDVLSE